MPFLVVPDEIILDQSFPRSAQELENVCISMAKLYELADQSSLYLVLTDVLEQIVVSANWSALAQSGKVGELQKFISLLFLSQHPGLVNLDLDTIIEYQAHPKIDPAACSGMVDFWADELGRLWVMHSNVVIDGRPHLGIACTNGFSGSAKRSYSCAGTSKFPIVCENSFRSIETCIRYDIDPNIRNRSVSVTSVVRNIHLLGGKLHPRAGTSHQKVSFNGQRPWTLGHNDDPVPEAYLRQLEPITGASLDYIMHVLIEGELPDKINIFQDYIL